MSFILAFKSPVGALPFLALPLPLPFLALALPFLALALPFLALPLPFLALALPLPFLALAFVPSEGSCATGSFFFLLSLISIYLVEFNSSASLIFICFVGNG